MNDLQSFALLLLVFHALLVLSIYAGPSKHFHSENFETSPEVSLEDPAWRILFDYENPQGPECFGVQKVLIPIIPENELRDMHVHLNDERKYMEGLLQQRINFLFLVFLGTITIAVSNIDKIPAGITLAFLFVSSFIIRSLSLYMERAQAKLNLYLSLIFVYKHPAMMFAQNISDVKNDCFQKFFITGNKFRLNQINRLLLETFYAVLCSIFYIYFLLNPNGISPTCCQPK